MATLTPDFPGFPDDTLDFLAELDRNNDRAWFEANRSRYETLVREPALAFISAMAEPLAEFAPRFSAIPKRSGGSLMRVHRDVRFSRDKRPYKTNIGIQFRHELGRDVHAPGYYVHIDPWEVFLGVGCWRPDPVALAAIRRRIAESPSDWESARDDGGFSTHFGLAGESLKRPPRGFDPDHPMIGDLKRKDFIAVGHLDPASIHGPDFAIGVAGAFAAAGPFMAFLCRALGTPV
jgi:uncharacterized protein (TIGR02453 family)